MVLKYSKNFLLIGVLLVIIFQTFVIFFINSEYANSFVENDSNIICSSSDFIEIKDISRYEYEVREISIFPKIKNLFCLNKIVKSSLNPETLIYFISSNLYKYLFYFFQFFIMFAFTFSNKKYLYYPFSILSAFLNLFLFNSNFIYEDLVIQSIFYTISNLILFSVFNRDIKNRNAFDLLTLALLFFLINNYQIFSNFLIIYFLIYFYKNKLNDIDIINSYKTVLMFLPVYFYFTKIIFALSEKFLTLWKNASGNIFESSKIFGDFQLILRAVSCNFENFKKEFKFSDTYHTCPFDTGYPLIDYNLSFSISDFWATSIVFYFLCFLILSYSYINFINRYRNYSFYIFILVLSSPVNFLLERLNLDLPIFLLSLYAIFIYKRFKIISNLLLLFLFTVKIYPIFFLVFLTVIDFSHKNLKKIYINFLSLMLGAAYLYNIVFINNSSLTSTNNPSPIFQGDWFSNDTLTFGIVSHIKYLNQFFETNISLTILISIFIVIFWIVKKVYKTQYTAQNRVDYLYLSTIGTFILLSLHENFDYRLVVLLMIFQRIFEKNDKLLIFVYSSVILTSATYYFYINFLVVIINILLSSLLVVLFAIDLYNYIFKKEVKT